MRNLIKMLILVVCISINTGCKKNAPMISIARADTPVYIDGLLESAWKQASWNPIRHVTLSKQDTIITPANISGNFKTLWDRKNCYFFIQVTDDVKYRRPLPKDPFKAKYDFFKWPDENDAVKIFIDSKQNGLAKDQQLLNQYTFIYHYDSVLVTSDFKSDIKNIQFAQADTKVGYTMEIAIPWENLNIDITQKRALGLQIFIVDNDKRQIEIGIPPFSDSIISWFDTGIFMTTKSALPTNVSLSDRLSDTKAHLFHAFGETRIRPSEKFFSDGTQ